MHAKLQIITLVVTCLLISSCNSGGSGLEDASYQITFNSSWSAATHPDDFPASPHFSGLIGVTHNGEDVYWEINKLATAGIESMAETGSKVTLTAEINEKIEQGNSNALISEDGLGNSPGSVSFNLNVKSDFHRITLVSMLAPSPDWFVGVSGLSLIENGEWVESKTVKLYVYDAGTDDGATYSAANADSNPKQVIKRIEASPFLVDGEVTPIGEFVFVKL